MTLTNQQQITMLRKMWLIRYFEEAAIRLNGEGLYRGSTHPYIAQEATAVGVVAALKPGDKALATYRGHGAYLAMGGDPSRGLAELLGKETGVCKGKGGSMHLSDVSLGFMGSNAIVGAHIPIAGGVALSQQLDGTDNVTVCFFGDGASCEGVFYETCNMAALWNLPLILVVENNEFAISTHVSKAVCVPDISIRAQGFGFPGVTIDGREVDAVYAAATDAVQRARQGGGPTLIEAKTVRWTRHSAVSAGGYGSGSDGEKWRQTDPIPRYQAALVSRGILTDVEVTAIEAEARAAIDDAARFAVNSPAPSLDALTTDMFA